MSKLLQYNKAISSKTFNVTADIIQQTIGLQLVIIYLMIVDSRIYVLSWVSIKWYVNGHIFILKPKYHGLFQKIE